MPQTGIVLMAFGAGKNLESNQCLAATAARASKRHGKAPVFSQLDITPENTETEQIQGEDIATGHYANTMQMATAAVKWAMRNNMTHLRVVAAAPHMLRALHDLDYVVSRDKVRLRVEPERGIWRPDTVWFNIESQQLHTQHAFWWLLWEMPIAILQFISMDFYVWLTDRPLGKEEGIWP